jgi:hypothetical protein
MTFEQTVMVLFVLQAAQLCLIQHRIDKLIRKLDAKGVE